MGRKIQFRRGPESTRVETVLSNGEPGWSTEREQLFIGDGETAGGIPVLMGVNKLIKFSTSAIAGSRYIFTSVADLMLPNNVPEGSVIQVTLIKSAGATPENPARVLAPSGSTISIDATGEAGIEYHLTISGIERVFLFINGGWLLV